MWSEISRTLHNVPAYLFALKAAFGIFIGGAPIYAGLRYFMYRRKLNPPKGFIISFIAVFVLYALLAFVYASPLSNIVPFWAIRPFLFVTAVLSAYAALEAVDLFFVDHYLRSIHHVYISPPVRTASKITVFCVVLLPILRYTLAFNPLALVAIPTILTAGIAFAMQDTLKSIFAGIGLGNIMHVGQWISVQNNVGRVIDITWSRTILQTGDGNQIFIPNSQLQNQIVLNYTIANPMTQATFKVGVSYDSPPPKVKEVILKSIQGIPGMATELAAVVNILEYGESAVQYMIYFWVIDYTQVGNIKDQVASRVWEALRQEKIEIPYPTRTVHLRTIEGETSFHS